MHPILSKSRGALLGRRGHSSLGSPLRESLGASWQHGHYDNIRWQLRQRVIPGRRATKPGQNLWALEQPLLLAMCKTSSKLHLPKGVPGGS